MIDERTKDMTASEWTAYFNQRGEAATKKYGFKFVASMTDVPPINERAH